MPVIFVPENDQPDGAVTVKAVIAYALPDGLVILRVTGVLPVITFGVKDSVGGTAFDAETVVASGTRNSIPESARSATISPELIFF